MVVRGRESRGKDIFLCDWPWAGHNHFLHGLEEHVWGPQYTLLMGPSLHSVPNKQSLNFSAGHLRLFTTLSSFNSCNSTPGTLCSSSMNPLSVCQTCHALFPILACPFAPQFLKLDGLSSLLSSLNSYLSTSLGMCQSSRHVGGWE